MRFVHTRRFPMADWNEKMKKMNRSGARWPTSLLDCCRACPGVFPTETSRNGYGGSYGFHPANYLPGWPPSGRNIENSSADPRTFKPGVRLRRGCTCHGVLFLFRFPLSVSLSHSLSLSFLFSLVFPAKGRRPGCKLNRLSSGFAVRWAPPPRFARVSARSPALPQDIIFLAATVRAPEPPVRGLTQYRTSIFYLYIHVPRFVFWTTYSLCTAERCDVSREWPRTGNTAFSCGKHNRVNQRSQCMARIAYKFTLIVDRDTSFPDDGRQTRKYKRNL